MDADQPGGHNEFVRAQLAELRETVAHLAERLEAVAGSAAHAEQAIERLEAMVSRPGDSRDTAATGPDTAEQARHGIQRMPRAQPARAIALDALPLGRPVRAVVLDALEDLGCPAYSRELAPYARARFGRHIAPERFGSLGKDEVNAYLRGAHRPVWLCYALTHDRHAPIKRLWARSDWPLERRIVAPTTARVQHLMMTERLCDLALRTRATAAEPELMQTIAAEHARDLPGITVRHGEFDLKLWRDRASELLAELEPRDREARMESAQRLSRQPAFYQLFGVPDIAEGEMTTEEGRQTP